MAPGGMPGSKSGQRVAGASKVEIPLELLYRILAESSILTERSHYLAPR